MGENNIKGAELFDSKKAIRSNVAVFVLKNDNTIRVFEADIYETCSSSLKRNLNTGEKYIGHYIIRHKNDIDFRRLADQLMSGNIIEPNLLFYEYMLCL
jgi:hypothetical protein